MSAPVHLFAPSSDVLEMDSDERQLVGLMRQIHDHDGPDRSAMLLDWYRSDWYHPVLMMCEDWQGQIAREAHHAYTKAIERWSPAKRWADAPIQTGRASILRILNLDRVPEGIWGSLPFKAIRIDDRPWIAGALGPCLFTMDQCHLDITDVILWCPKTNEVRIDGDLGPRLIAAPSGYSDGQSVTVYQDGAAFFRDWAAERMRHLAWFKRGPEYHPKYSHPPDSHMPGALAIGGLKQPWSMLHAPTLRAGPGVNRAELTREVFASYHLPRIETARHANV